MLQANRLFDTDVKGGPRLRRSVPFAAGQLQRYAARPLNLGSCFKQP
jgi:hypothetical protein